jgi:hypothetical protein
MFFFNASMFVWMKNLSKCFLRNDTNQTFQLLKWYNQFIFNIIWLKLHQVFQLFEYLKDIFALCSISWQHINSHKYTF